MEGEKHALFKTNLWTRFTHEGITEFGCTAESGSLEKERALSMMIDLSGWIEI
jgi:hypothetical protein